jgi:hypothetical protein
VHPAARRALRGRGRLPRVLADEAQVVLADAALAAADLDGADRPLLHVGGLRGVIDEEPVLLGLDQLALLELVARIVPAHRGVGLHESAGGTGALGHFCGAGKGGA